MGRLRDRCFEFGDDGARAVVVGEHGTLDAATLSDAIRRRAGALRARGIRIGDRVGWLGPTDPDTIVGILAIQFAGAIAVPLCPRHTAGELQHVVDDSDCAALVAHPTLLDRVAGLGRTAWSSAELPADAAPAPACDVDDTDPALLIYTSGTTGRSKGVALPWRAVVANMTALGAAWGLGPTDRCASMLPLFHVHGLCIGVYAMLLAQATIHVHPKFDATALVADVRDHGVTVFLGVPTMYVALLEHLGRHPDDAAVLSRARLFTAGSAALAPSTLAKFEAATGHRILERYGMTETLITLSNPLHGERRAGTVGMPVGGVEVRIVGDDGGLVAVGTPGELQVRGDSLMLGYWRNPEATAAAFDDTWFRTGDVAVRDDGGRIAILGRSSTDIIKSGGFKISALEIEDALREHPQVADVAVLGLSDDRWGERVVAVIEAATAIGRSDLVDALTRHVRTRLADYKCPRQWIVVDALRRNQMGKLEKARIRADVAAYVGDVDARRSHT